MIDAFALREPGFVARTADGVDLTRRELTEALAYVGIRGVTRETLKYAISRGACPMGTVCHLTQDDLKVWSALAEWVGEDALRSLLSDEYGC